MWEGGVRGERWSGRGRVDWCQGECGVVGEGGMPSNIRPWGPGTMLKGVKGGIPARSDLGFGLVALK